MLLQVLYIFDKGQKHTPQTLVPDPPDIFANSHQINKIQIAQNLLDTPTSHKLPPLFNFACALNFEFR